ncbi:hypothetical protein CH379_004005 [Leptospira ellisii]|uniref:Uncharacterized protein n=1 Tax=Leptospira ellisii TaxID=2023197 RepID=A0AAE4QKP6_9LEPT|nr:hypothetical protein [Leptospira ellisii]MDV6234793.1 hypothetical protein [Leptospira ellisii]
MCTTFKYAKLEKDSLRILRDFERKLDGLILVAYSSPLERW